MKDLNQIESNVAQVDIDIDEIFNGAPQGSDVLLPSETPTKKSVFAKNESADLSFLDEESSEKKDEIVDKKIENTDNILDSLIDTTNDDEEEDDDDEKTETRGRKKISGISDVFQKLIKENKIVPFEDDKPLEEYSAKDWEELIEANLEEKVNQARQETPQKFFESLPRELQYAAQYVVDGGQDLKGLFATLAQVEETKDLDPRNDRDQEYIIREYLHATGFGTSDEIQEEIDTWKDLGKIEQQAIKFKSKLDKMQEQIVAQKLEEQKLRKKQQLQASQQYMESVYNVLKDGQLGDIKIDRKVQAMLYNGLVQPNYASLGGSNTNLLGHLLDKYQYIEPNYGLLSEALWLLADPDGYKSKIMEKGSQKAIETTVRKLKTEQSNMGNANSLGIDEDDDNQRTQKMSKKLPRTNNIFKRF